jgi:hypothetical protein
MHALVYTRLTPFVIVHALVAIFFLVLCIGYRRSISDHGGLSSERKNVIPCSRGCSLLYVSRLHRTFLDY